MDGEGVVGGCEEAAAALVPQSWVPLPAGCEAAPFPPCAAMRGRERGWWSRRSPDNSLFFPFSSPAFLPPAFPREIPAGTARKPAREERRRRRRRCGELPSGCHRSQVCAWRGESRPRLGCPCGVELGLRKVVGGGGKLVGVEGTRKPFGGELALEAGSSTSLMKAGATVGCSGRKNGEGELQSI